MIYLVQTGTFCHLKFISKICAVTPRYYCMIGVYTLQGFQGHKICKLWPSGLFSMEFTRSGPNLWFEFEFKIEN
jgi:hypothetical protein